MPVAIGRRELIAALGSAATWPLAARAQQPMPVIGFLSPGSAEADTGRMNAFRRGLTEIGYVEGQNVAIEYRGAQYQYDHLPALVGEVGSPWIVLVNERCEVHDYFPLAIKWRKPP